MNMYFKKKILCVTDLKVIAFCLIEALVHFSELQMQLPRFY